MRTRSTGSAPNKRPTAKSKASQAHTLLAQFMTVEEDGSLAQRVREVVADNRRKARSRHPG